MRRIILTGGGTAGHVTPNLALVPKLIEEGFEIDYIGSYNGMEKELVLNSKIPYHKISSGKLRRYFSFKNLSDVFNVLKGLGDAKHLIKKLKPGIIFSKGGFVSVPVVVAGKLLGVPVIIHESDITPGLANKISFPFASAVCSSFPEALRYMPKKKAILTGPPIRESLFDGNRENGLHLCCFDGSKPILLVMGGSLGSIKINNAVRQSLDELLKYFDVAHICGKNNVDTSLNRKGYTQFTYLSNELNDIFACADIVISRAGSNSIFEFLALKKPNLLIPLSKHASRGDQILNAESFEKQGFSKVLYEEDLTNDLLLKASRELLHNKDYYIENMKKSPLSNGIYKIIDVIIEHYKQI